MKKIIFIHLLNDRSGSPKVLSQVIDAIKADGYYTEVLTSAHHDGFLSHCADKNVNIFYKRSENKILTLCYYLLSQVFLFFKCLRYRKQSVVFYVNTMMPFGGALAGKLIRKPVIYHVHETSLKPAMLKRFLRKIIAITADRVIFVSQYVKSIEMIKTMASEKQPVIYNAIAPEENNQSITSQEPFVVLMVCSLKAYKGIFEFIALADRMKRQQHIAFQLVLNANSDEIAGFLKDTDLPANVEIIERQNHLSPFYQNAGLLLNLSRPDGWVETFGLTILEAMVYAVPSIVPTVGGPAEIVRDGIDGYHISCYEIDKIAEKIDELLENPEHYEVLCRNARTRAKDFEQEKFEKQIINTIKDVSDEKS